MNKIPNVLRWILIPFIFVFTYLVASALWMLFYESTKDIPTFSFLRNFLDVAVIFIKELTSLSSAVYFAIYFEQRHKKIVFIFLAAAWVIVVLAYLTYVVYNSTDVSYTYQRFLLESIAHLLGFAVIGKEIWKKEDEL